MPVGAPPKGGHHHRNTGQSRFAKQPCERGAPRGPLLILVGQVQIHHQDARTRGSEERAGHWSCVTADGHAVKTASGPQKTPALPICRCTDSRFNDVFYYVYGMLHDPAYRERYAADLKKMLPHIPDPESLEVFSRYVTAGRALADLHVNYETVQPYPLDVQVRPGADPDSPATWRVDRMRWGKTTDPATGKNVDDLSTIVYTGRVTITGIPRDAHRYMLGSRTALGWILDRYQVRTDNASGIVNDPNDWATNTTTPPTSST